MIPKHVLDVLNKLTPAQQQKFQELCMWSGSHAMTGCKVPIDYDRIIDMVTQMGPTPIEPVPAPPLVDQEMLDRLKAIKVRNDE